MRVFCFIIFVQIFFVLNFQMFFMIFLIKKICKLGYDFGRIFSLCMNIL